MSRQGCSTGWRERRRQLPGIQRSAEADHGVEGGECAQQCECAVHQHAARGKRCLMRTCVAALLFNTKPHTRRCLDCLDQLVQEAPEAATAAYGRPVPRFARVCTNITLTGFYHHYMLHQNSQHAQPLLRATVQMDRPDEL
eukprot:scaffold133234_cov66-Phaeocystis_antarctica.AAC.2